jgi:nitrite reductase/ring-hydroxylating ferredoxin subunit
MTNGDDCEGCPLIDRRAFLREAGAAVATLVALGIPAATAGALPMRLIRAGAVFGTERAYAIPATDGVEIDKDESVIITRVQGVLYAFSLACPHQNTALRWDEGEKRFQCPKHHSRYEPDGTFIEGRATRSMDRFAVRVEGGKLMVDLDKLYREDEDPGPWRAAFAKIGG